MPLAALMGLGPSELANIFNFSPKVSPDNCVLVGVRDIDAIEKENQIIGYIGLWFLGDQCQITTIATDRHFQGQGYASQLMEYALEKSEELHYQNVNLEVRVSNKKAQSLYRTLGFENGKIKENYYSGDREDALEMSKFL